MAILEVHHIEKHFGATRVLEDISFDLEQGQALAIIGRQNPPAAVPEVPGEAGAGYHLCGG